MDEVFLETHSYNVQIDQDECFKYFIFLVLENRNTKVTIRSVFKIQIVIIAIVENFKRTAVILHEKLRLL